MLLLENFLGKAIEPIPERACEVVEMGQIRWSMLHRETPVNIRQCINPATN